MTTLAEAVEAVERAAVRREDVAMMRRTCDEDAGPAEREAAALRHAASLLRAGEWRDISTAPRDRTRILIAYRGDSRPEAVVFWDERRELWSAADGGWGSDRYESSPDLVWLATPPPPERAG